MGKKISSQTRKELLEGMRRRYRESSKMDKTRILDEFVALTDYHRKYGVRLLSQLCYNEARAGAYAITEQDEFVERIEGSLTNVMGLPMELVEQLLKGFAS